MPDSGKRPATTAPAPWEEQAPDRAHLYDILTRAGFQGRDAHVFTQLVEEMASANLIHRFENKLEAQLEAQKAQLEAQNKAQNATISTLKWMIGLGFTALGILITVLTLVA